jgi:hypothetical protein
VCAVVKVEARSIRHRRLCLRYRRMAARLTTWVTVDRLSSAATCRPTMARR